MESLEDLQFSSSFREIIAKNKKDFSQINHFPSSTVIASTSPSLIRRNEAEQTVPGNRSFIRPLREENYRQLPEIVQNTISLEKLNSVLIELSKSLRPQQDGKFSISAEWFQTKYGQRTTIYMFEFILTFCFSIRTLQSTYHCIHLCKNTQND